MTPNDLNGAAAVSDELLPCPFCGSSNINLADLAGYEVWCTDCGAMAGTVNEHGDAHNCASAIAAWNRRALAAAGKQAEVPEGFKLVPDHANADAVVTSLYRRFKDWNKRGFGPDDVTWCEVRADVLAMLAAATQQATPEALPVKADSDVSGAQVAAPAEPADASPSDTERLDFMLNNDAFTVRCNRDGSIIQYQLMTQDEDENYEVLHNERRFYNTEREAIDAAIAAAQPANGGDRG